MRGLIALAAILAPATASATSICDSLKQIVATADGQAAIDIVPDGWRFCVELPHKFTCWAPGGRPQATVFAHLYAVNAEIAACYGVPGAEDGENRRSFRIEPGITVSTYTEGFGQPDGGIRMRIEFAHPS